MRINLIGEMAKRNISINAIADTLGIHRNSVANKIYGKSDFTVEQAIKIHDRFFCDCDFKVLFTAR